MAKLLKNYDLRGLVSEDQFARVQLGAQRAIVGTPEFIIARDAYLSRIVEESSAFKTADAVKTTPPCLTAGSRDSAKQPFDFELAPAQPRPDDEPVVPVPVGGKVSGVIDTAGDTDTITVDLVAGKTYLISLVGSGGTPLPDSFLELFNPSATSVGEDDDGGQGLHSLLTVTAAATGAYSIVAAGVGSGTGGYTVNVRKQGADIPGDDSTTAVANVGKTTFGFIETDGDTDWYQVTLVAGEVYDFELAGGADYNTDWQAVPPGELDTIIRIRDASGNIVASNDDLDFPLDISSGLGFTPGTSGAYFVEVDAYAGQTGGYTLDIDVQDLSGGDPLRSIDWGSMLAANAVKVYFAPAGETHDGVQSEGWTQYEQDQAMAALETFAELSGLSFSVTTNVNQANFKLVTTSNVGYLGYFNPPGETNAGVGVFANDGTGWDTNGSNGGLEPGGYGWITLIHEFGHGLGLAHPHDNGGASEIMIGVTSAFGSYGAFDLNQGVYTTMSYNDGWQLHPNAVGGFPDPDTLDYGYQAGPGALDIAVIQDKYGPQNANGGDSVYTLPKSNTPGNFWTCIWDTNGVDTIAHAGPLDAQIDLTAATLDYSPTGGGAISWADGIFGGFTIANGVVIENATGGKGDDGLIGNLVKNVLNGGRGDDTMLGNGGKDTIKTGLGDDVVQLNSTAGSSADKVTDFDAGTDKVALDSEVYGLAEGALAANRFVLGAAAGDANDRLIYDGASGKLWFDADGTGAGAQKLIATFTNFAALASTDFVVI